MSPGEALRAQYDETDELVTALGADLEAMIAASAGSNADDEHDPEGATIAFERAAVIHLQGVTLARRTELAAALRRVDAGTYGRCDRCGTSIAAVRLAARPTASECFACADRVSGGRPRSRPHPR